MIMKTVGYLRNSIILKLEKYLTSKVVVLSNSCKTKIQYKDRSMERTDKVRQYLQQVSGDKLESLLSNDDINKVFAIPKTHKQQPLARLLDPHNNNKFGSVAQVLANTNRAIGFINQRYDMEKWLCKKLKVACGTDFADASGALAEIRALGMLLEAGFNPRCVPEGDEPTPDFELIDEGINFNVTATIEVTCRQMDGNEATKLAKFNNNAPSQPDNNVCIIHTLGPPSKNKHEHTTMNVVHRIASLKQGDKQIYPNTPHILWVDFQDEDMFGIENQIVPVEVDSTVDHEGNFHSGGIWLGFFGHNGDEVLYNARCDEEFTSQMSTPMNFKGRFQQEPLLSLAVLSFPRLTILFENPNPQTAIQSTWWPKAFKLPWISFAQSYVSWPDNINMYAQRINDIRDFLTRVSSACCNRVQPVVVAEEEVAKR